MRAGSYSRRAMWPTRPSEMRSGASGRPSRTAIAWTCGSRSPLQFGEIEVTHFDDAPRTNSEDPANRGENMPRAVAGGFIDQNEMTADGYSCVTWRQLWLEPKTHRFAPSIR